MNFKKWAKCIQTAGYNGARTVVKIWEKISNKSIDFLSNSKKTPWIVGYNSNNFLFCLQFLFIAFIEENLENFWYPFDFCAMSRLQFLFFHCLPTAFRLAWEGVSGWWVGADFNGLPFFFTNKRYFFNISFWPTWPAASVAKFICILEPF